MRRFPWFPFWARPRIDKSIPVRSQVLPERAKPLFIGLDRVTEVFADSRGRLHDEGFSRAPRPLPGEQSETAGGQRRILGC